MDKADYDATVLSANLLITGSGEGGVINGRNAELREAQRIVMLATDEAMMAAVNQVPDEVWSWLDQQRWLISVNSRGEHWTAWPPILARHPELRLLVSHLGLPPAVEQAPTAPTARQELGSVLALAKFPGVRVKLSGFYALTNEHYWVIGIFDDPCEILDGGETCVGKGRAT